MYQKVTPKAKHESMECTRASNFAGLRANDASTDDLSRLLRREQVLRKKLKTVMQANSNLEKEIKQYDAQIKEDRANISFHFNELMREMAAKFNLYTEEKLERRRFSSNEVAQASIRDMLGKYQKVEQQCRMLQKTVGVLASMHAEYAAHAGKMQESVANMEANNLRYQEQIDNLIEEVNEQTKVKAMENERIVEETREAVLKIDQAIADTVQANEEETLLTAKLDSLRKVVSKRQQKIEEMGEWAKLVIDKTNRAVAGKMLSTKEQQLRKMREQNEQLQMYYNQLQSRQCTLRKHEKRMAADEADYID